jgi:hypothetical protein
LCHRSENTRNSASSATCRYTLEKQFREPKAAQKEIPVRY